MHPGLGKNLSPDPRGTELQVCLLTTTPCHIPFVCHSLKTITSLEVRILNCVVDSNIYLFA